MILKSISPSPITVSSRAVLIAMALALPMFAFQSRLVDENGKPVPFAHVSVVDQSGGTMTDAEGRFSIVPDPRLPATLIVIGNRGELYPPIHLDALRDVVLLEAAYRDSMTVTSGAAPNIEGTPASAPVLVGTEELEQRKPAHIAEAITATPGVALRGEGPPAVPVVRGLSGGRTLLLFDDARIVSERRAGPSATFVDPMSLGSIEISRGPGSVAYGSDALGGIVHLRPRDPIPGQPRARYDVWASFGGRPARSVALEGSVDALGGAVLASIHARTAEDAKDGSGATIDNSQFRDRGALLRFVRDASWGRMRIGALTSVVRDAGAPSSDPIRTIYPDERASLLTFALDMPRARFFDSASIRAALGSYAITTNRVRATGVESTAVKARDGSIRVSGDRATGRARLVVGADLVTRFDLHARGSIDDADRTNLGAFASWDGRVAPAVQFAAGGRLDQVATKNRGGFFGNRSTSDTVFSGFAAVTAGPIRRVTGTVQIASGYREPSLSDRYFRGVSGRGFVTGNPLLEPERSVQFDGGLRWNGDRARIAWFVYDYRIRDLVERYRSGADFFFRNRGEAEVRGMELEVSTRLWPSIEWVAGAAIARGEADGDPIDDIAPPTLHTSLHWAAEQRSAFAGISVYGRDKRPGPVETERAGYATVDAGIGWRFTPWLELRIIARNLTDRRYFGSSDAAAAFAPGRSITIGVNR